MGTDAAARSIRGFRQPNGQKGRASLRLMYMLRRSKLHLRLHPHGVHLPLQLVSGAPLCDLFATPGDVTCSRGYVRCAV